MIQNYQNNFGKSKSAMEHQKLHGKLSEYVLLSTQTVSTTFVSLWNKADVFRSKCQCKSITLNFST